MTVPTPQTTPGNSKSFQYWLNQGVTPGQFMLDAGNYGFTFHAAVWGTGVTLQRVLTSGQLVSVAATVTADGYQYLQLPAGQYQLTFGTTTGFEGLLEKIDAGRSRSGR